MLKKEVNQLKRGRIQGQAREQKKTPPVGEVTDPFVVLNDSISVKNRPQDAPSGDYIPSESRNERRNNAKTTSVDELDPLLDAEEPEFVKMDVKNSGRDRPLGPPRNMRRPDSKCHCSNRREESCEMPPNAEEEVHPCPRSDRKKCSCLCAIGEFFNKMMKFLGFKSSERCCSPKAKAFDGDNRPQSGSQKNYGHRKNNGYGKSRHHRTSPRKF
jgi:hypothetical protein